MVIALLGVIIGLQLLGLYRSLPAKPQPKPDPGDAVKTAYAKSGLNPDHFSPDFDLIPTGKLGDFIYHAAHAAGKPISTIQDVHDLLVK